jgi:hypothetical protein
METIDRESATGHIICLDKLITDCMIPVNRKIIASREVNINKYPIGITSQDS